MKCIFSLLLIIYLLSVSIATPTKIRAVEGEIVYTGTNTNLNGDDHFAGPLNLGFTFNYYGVDYTQAFININGTLNFGAGDSTYSNSALPGAGANTSIFAFWDDLVTFGQTPIYYATIGAAPERKFVAQWTNMYFFSTTIQMGTFQVILFEGSNQIQIQYRDLLGGDRALGNSATIGIKKNNTTGEHYSTNVASIVQGQTIRYTPNGTDDYTVQSLVPQNGGEVSSEYDLVYLAPEGSPASPTLVNPTNGLTGVTLTPTFEWLPVDSATFYTVLVSTVANFSSTIVNATGHTGTSYVLGTPLSTNTTYYWRVQSVNNKGSSLSSTRSFTTGSANTAPNPPDDVASSMLIGGAQLLSTNGATLSGNLSDPDDNEQVRYRIQIASDVSFNNLLIDYRSPFLSEGPFLYTVGEETGTYLVGQAGTVLSADEYYLRIRAEDDAAASSSWFTISGVAFELLPDTDGPVISSLTSDNVSSTSAMIQWTTNEVASSIVDYGLVSSYGFLTAELNTSPRVTEHSVQLSSLKPCARYFFRARSKDASNNQSTSSNQNFTTSGCRASSISSGVEESVPLSGGTVSLVRDQIVASLIVPSNFSSQQAAFQLNRLDTRNVPEGPAGRSLAGDNFFDLVAVNEDDEEIITFDEPVTFTVEYDSQTEQRFDENSLDVYKYLGTGWEKKNCVVDTSENTLTCTLPSFSTYGVFGEGLSNQTTNSPVKQSGISTSEAFGPAGPAAPPGCSSEKPVGNPDLFQINTTKYSAELFFTPISNTQQFYISYSTNPFGEEHGTLVELSREGVQSARIFDLLPHTTYYFKVRGQIGCMPGDWSGTFRVITTQNTNYKYLPINAVTLGANYGQ